VRSLSETLGWGRSANPALAGFPVDPARAKVLLRGERSAGRSFRWRIPLDRPPPAAFEIALTLGILVAVAGVGAVRGGQYQAFAERHGGIEDIVARHLGFGLDVVTISGVTHLDEPRILSLAGITPKNSLPFFDVAAARDRLESDPLVKQASVRKLYPNQIVIDIVERTPYAVWQKDGDLRAVGVDGGPIDDVRDARYIDLPFVVGEGANLRVREFTSLLASLEELRPRVEAGVLVGQRRWNIKLKSGIDIKLPESNPEAAIATLLGLERQSRVLERDILAVDLRTPDRTFIRLSQEAADAWAAAHAPKKASQP
jgi:cell division protein FtsQ